jgi:hypothetical protein
MEAFCKSKIEYKENKHEISDICHDLDHHHD